MSDESGAIYAFDPDVTAVVVILNRDGSANLMKANDVSDAKAVLGVHDFVAQYQSELRGERDWPRCPECGLGMYLNHTNDGGER